MHSSGALAIVDIKQLSRGLLKARYPALQEIAKDLPILNWDRTLQSLWAT